MEAVLEKEWPVGTTVRFYLMHGQRNPSVGQVIGHTGGRYAYLRVRVESRKNVVRDVSARNVW